MKCPRRFSAILPNTVGDGRSFIGSTDEVAGQKAHGLHIVFTAMSALVTGPGSLALPGSWEGIALLAVSAFRDGPSA
jgi:hypothetical protein